MLSEYSSEGFLQKIIQKKNVLVVGWSLHTGVKQWIPNQPKNVTYVEMLKTEDRMF